MSGCVCICYKGLWCGRGHSLALLTLCIVRRCSYVDRASLNLFVPSAAYLKSLCPWCLMSAIMLAEIYYELVSRIAFSYIFGLGASGRLRPSLFMTSPLFFFPLCTLPQRHAICFSDGPLERRSAKINENPTPQRKGRVSILQQLNFPGKASFCKQAGG